MLKEESKMSKNVKGDSMRKTMVLITISSLLLAGAVVAVDGGENNSSTAGTVKSRTFNVLN